MLEVTVDKFIFRVPEELFFSEEGIWLALEGKRARIGLSDLAQQVNGDIAFANVIPAGSKVNPGGEIGSIDTVILTVNRPSFGTGLMENCPGCNAPIPVKTTMMWFEVSEVHPFRVTSHQYSPSSVGISHCPVAHGLGVPSMYHWVPSGAVLMRVSPLHAINGVGGIG